MVGERPQGGPSSARAKQIEAGASGAAGPVPKISQGTIHSLTIPDLPLDEQRRIEREVSARAAVLDDASTALVRLQARLAEYRDACVRSVSGNSGSTPVATCARRREARRSR